MKQINTIIQLRRDNDYNFEKIKNTFTPANGEVVLVDTVSTGLRIKIGDGSTVYGQLPYADEDYRQNVILGYYENNTFYDSLAKNNVLNPDSNKIYIDTSGSNAYYYNGSNYINLQGVASTNSAGIMRLYNDLGNNTDGTITQKKITEEFQARYKTSVDNAEELLIFSL